MHGIVVLLGFAAVVGVVYGQCTVSIKVKGQPVEVNKALGVWHEYRHLDFGPIVPYDASKDPSSYNLLMNGTALGINPEPGKDAGSTSYAVSWMYNGLQPGAAATDPLTCVAIWQSGNFNSDGRRVVKVQFDTNPPYNTIEDFTYTNLFTDYNLVQVLFRCNTPNANGVTCDEPYAWVLTRIKPPLLTTAQKQYIEAIANYYIPPVVCNKFKFADMWPTKWDLSKTGPPCNVADNQPPMSSQFRALLPVKWAGA
ncbi:uncharacterized protein LOC129600658 [Paramacrobiotus metropolitanus]|uniref:uncharacterized protein LOC129600658 n=1 Tax=Paramacrobiotus metropolitanus TaxID=2943436 RepID=UPI00244637B6|nr:uncharacterized protein LOC129600658 [Paramacrobiotus metropolitanus]